MTDVQPPNLANWRLMTPREACPLSAERYLLARTVDLAGQLSGPCPECNGYPVPIYDSGNGVLHYVIHDRRVRTDVITLVAIQDTMSYAFDIDATDVGGNKVHVLNQAQAIAHLRRVTTGYTENKLIEYTERAKTLGSTTMYQSGGRY